MAVKITPDDSARKGDLWGPKHDRRCRQGVWTLFGRPPKAGIDVQMRNILREIAPVKNRLRRLLREHKHIRAAVIDIGYGPRGDLARACFTLRSDLVKEFVSLGIDVEISYYLPYEYR